MLIFPVYFLKFIEKYQDHFRAFSDYFWFLVNFLSLVRVFTSLKRKEEPFLLTKEVKCKK